MINRKLLGLVLLALAACDPPQGNSGAAASNSAQAAPAPPAEKVLKSETVEAVFTGWEVGDYVWANLRVKGREASGAWVGPSPLEHFLEAHKGKPIRVTIETVRVAIPEAGGGEQEVPKIAAASAGGVTAQAWWDGLDATRRAAAERRMEEVLGGGGV